MRHEEDALLPQDWHEGEELFSPGADGPLAPPGGSGTGVRPGEEQTAFMQEVEELKGLYPTFREMPEEVANAVAAGESVKTAYTRWHAQQKQAGDTAERIAHAAAARGVSRGGMGEGGDLFLMGFEQGEW